MYEIALTPPLSGQPGSYWLIAMCESRAGGQHARLYDASLKLHGPMLQRVVHFNWAPDGSMFTLISYPDRAWTMPPPGSQSRVASAGGASPSAGAAVQAHLLAARPGLRGLQWAWCRNCSVSLLGEEGLETLLLVSVPGHAVMELPAPKTCTSATWSTHGSLIALLSHQELAIVRVPDGACTERVPLDPSQPGRHTVDKLDHRVQSCAPQATLAG